MIHQFIFAAPKPGMSVAAFQRYWLEVHAVRYAAKIPQIRRYLIDTRVPFEGDLGDPPLPHKGIAEIWLENEQQQLASLQSKEFLHGARLDEPNWAAFWQTLAVDTTPHRLGSEPAPRNDPAGVKLTILLKRRPGMSLEEYREATLGPYAAAVADLPGVRGHLHCHTRDGAYVFGEPPFDSVEQLWFTDLEALNRLQTSRAYTDRLRTEREHLADPRYVFSMACQEHWIIGPQPRTQAEALTTA
ncbi:EthD domain-containing protein [Actinomadura kijaniata]|uniref:EthD domain-containing protein n=1 Tax=Actinomadura kijaniata TaxID=46161 RepID=UPI003F1CE8DA